MPSLRPRDVSDRIRLRRRINAGAGRVWTSWWSIGQSALGAALAWEAAVRLLGHPAPFFAAVAAVICLSITVLNRLRRVLELAVGVTIGVAVGDLMVAWIGRGAWQLALVVLLGMSLARLLGSGALIVNQAALQAVLVTAMPAAPGGSLGRWQDALLGGAVALGVAFALPADPRPAMRQGAADVVRAVGEALRDGVRAARANDADAAQAALDRGRATEPLLTLWAEAVQAAEEISRLSPLRRASDAEIRAHRQALEPTDRAVRNLRVALRRLVAAVEDAVARPPDDPDAAGQTPLSASLVDRLDEFAGALHTLPGALRDPDGEGGRRALAAVTALATRLDPEDLAVGSVSATVVVAQVRSAAIDLLEAVGHSHQESRAVFGR